MSHEWEQYRDRYLAERPETYDAYVDVWTTDVDVRRRFSGWAFFSQCANAEPAKRRDEARRVEEAEAAMERRGYIIGPSTPRGARRWMRGAVSSPASASAHSESTPRPAIAREVTCPNCPGVLVPLAGSCGWCGWSPVIG